ncbi:hypothetical protein BLOT_009428 [Blomia tropicalis]|nr:hypothetical protein BLOT_009428 [Blomia tropicalis]
MSANEEKKLLISPHDSASSKSYQTLQQRSELPKNDTIVYCIHGNDSELCCEMTSTKDGQNSISKIDLPHCHYYDEERSKTDKQARFRLILASILCLVFMLIEIVGGILANSLAIASDAAHLLTDFASFMISLFSIWMASRPASHKMSFGWHRAEVVGALTSVLMIWVVTGILCYVATERILENSFEIDAKIMVITATVGVIVNLIMGMSLTLGGVPHGHSHGGGSGHSHVEHGHQHDDHGHGGFSSSANQGKGNINVRAAFIHVLGDFFQSLGVLIASLVIYFFPEYHIIDPICTFIFSVIVLFTTFAIIRDVLNVLMEGIPKGIDMSEVHKTLFNIDGVRKVHNLRIWSLSLDKAALSTHLAIEKGHEPSKILNAALREIKSRYDIFELTIQIEEYHEEMRDCHQCQDIVSR